MKSRYNICCALESDMSRNADLAKAIGLLKEHLVQIPHILNGLDGCVGAFNRVFQQVVRALMGIPKRYVTLDIGYQQQKRKRIKKVNTEGQPRVMDLTGAVK